MTSRKRTSQISELPGTSIKQWKESPPGPEQKELERLFQNKIIDVSDTPNKIRLTNPMFMQFNARTFATHYRKTKAKYGFQGNPYK